MNKLFLLLNPEISLPDFTVYITGLPNCFTKVLNRKFRNCLEDLTRKGNYFYM